jgi:ketosteroid isomerase-like protein
VVEAAAGGDVGFVAAEFSFPQTTPGRGGAKGSVLQAWKRVNGEWIIAHSSFMDDPGAAAAPAKK